MVCSKKRESGGARTLDPRLKRPLLYQLSYRFVKSFKDPKDKEMTISKSNGSKNFFLKFHVNNLHKHLLFDTLQTEVKLSSIPSQIKKSNTMATLFTKIINGDIHSHKIAENDTHYAFLDINPIAKGHTLVIPKKEVDYFFDLSDDLMSDTMIFAKKIASAIDETLSPIRTGIIVEGLEVPHAHVHLVPIYKTSQKVALGHSIDVSEDEMKELAETISKGVKL